MKLPLPRSLRSQTLVVLVLGLAISHLIGIAIYSDDRRAALASSEALDIAEHTVATVALLQRIPPQWRQEMIQALERRTFRVGLADAPDAVDSPDTGEDDVAEVQRYLDDALPGRNIRSALARSARETASGVDAGIEEVAGVLRIGVELDDGAWLNVTGVIPAAHTLWPRPAGFYMVSVLIGVVAVGMWLVHRVTTPLTAFAQAADRLGKNLRSDAVPEKGPTEVVKAARAFNEMQSRLQRLIDNRTEMLAAISHDLRTPVTLLALRAELMAEGAEREKMMATLRDMESMISSLLDFARGTFQDEPNRLVDLAALVASLCDDLKDAGMDVHLTAPDQLLYRCRRVSLKRAITNLVDNAVKYAGGAEIVLREDASEIVIEVRDSGPGFPSVDLNDLFVPSFRAQRTGSWVEGSARGDTTGAGLGLGIAQAIVHGHGGALHIGNRPDGGATAEVRLPK